MFVARKITRAKWETKQTFAQGEIPADAVTVDLRTQDNSLSFWQCGIGEKAEIEDVVLAIAAGRDDVAKVEIVWLDGGELKADGQTLVDTDGRTPVASLVKRHVDVCKLDYERLGKVAHRVITAIAKNQCRRLTKKRVKDLLAAAVKQGRVKLADLSDSIQKQIDAQSRSK